MWNREDITKQGVIMILVCWGLFTLGILLFDGHLNTVVGVLTG